MIENGLIKKFKKKEYVFFLRDQMLLLFNCTFVFIFHDFVEFFHLLKRVCIYSNDILYNDITP